MFLPVGRYFLKKGNSGDFQLYHKNLVKGFFRQGDLKKNEHGGSLALFFELLELLLCFLATRSRLL
jgi:hypothetical protein